MAWSDRIKSNQYKKVKTQNTKYFSHKLILFWSLLKNNFQLFKITLLYFINPKPQKNLGKLKILLTFFTFYYQHTLSVESILIFDWTIWKLSPFIFLTEFREVLLWLKSIFTYYLLSIYNRLFQVEIWTSSLFVFYWQV